MNARNIPAEKKYYELANETQSICQRLLKVMNMEIQDAEIQKLLVTCLKRGKQIGLRGELIDAARHLYLLTDKVIKEMWDKSYMGLDEEEDQAIYEVSEEERPMNAYAFQLDKFIDLSSEELGLNSDVEYNLAAHPYSTDYLKLTNLNLNYVKKNLFEAKKFLKDEECFGYRNIFDKCLVLLSDAGDKSENSITYNLARNDQNLKMARIIFRYRCNLDKIFKSKA